MSLWIDEAYTVSVATRSLPDVWRMIQTIDIVHALYNVSLHPWFAAVGVSEITVRLPSTVAVIAATAGVIVLGRTLAGPTAGIVAGCIFAVLPRVTWMGIEGRSYALTAAIAVWWTVLFVTLVRRPSARWAVGYAVVGAVAISINIFAVLLIGAHGVALLATARVRFTRPFWIWFGAGVAATLGGAPVLLTAVSQAAQIGANESGILGLLRNVVVNQWFLGGTPTVYLSGVDSLGDAPGSDLWQPAAVLLALLCWLIIGYAVLRAGSPSTVGVDTRALLVSWLIVPTAIMVGYTMLGRPLYNPRYLTFCTPAVAALMSVGLVHAWRRGGRRRLLVSGLVVLILVLTTPIYASQRGLYAKSGADWSQLADFVAERRADAQGVYYAPRVPGPQTVGLTGRTAEIVYPRAYAGLRDITLISTPAAAGDLVGRTRPLADSIDQLSGLRAVFVIRRVDYPASAVEPEDRLLAAEGFVPGGSWKGPLNTVTMYER